MESITLATSRRTPTAAPLRVIPQQPEAHGKAWEQLWLGALASEWRSLVLVPADAEASSLGAAEALRHTAARYAQRPVHLIDATRAHASDVAGMLETIAGAISGEGQAIVAVASPIAHPAAIAIARAADAALLVVALGTTHFEAARRTLALIGRERFIGGVALRSRS